MHFSDCYQHIHNIKDEQKASKIKKSLEELEQKIQSMSFMAYLEENKSTDKSVTDLRQEFDIDRLNKAIEGMVIIKKELADETDDAIRKISAVLDNIIKSARNSSYRTHYHPSHYIDLANKYATHFVPFSQNLDPFHGTDFGGYCWGHSHRYAQLASQQNLFSLSVASDKNLYDTFRRNWTFIDVIFRRVGWYFSNIQQKQTMQHAIWDAFSQLDEKTTFNFNFFIDNVGFHSTSLRMVGAGIEYYDNNYGIVRFKCRQDAAKFLTKHMLTEAQNGWGNVRFITVYKLPYVNSPNHDELKELPQTQIEQKSNANKGYDLDEPLQTAIDKLAEYQKMLSKQSDIKAKIKANEIDCLIQKLGSLDAAEIKKQVGKILSEKKHSLLINRGTGFYFFKSGFKSHSTTESLLQDIHETAGKCCLTL